ncbi:glucose-1-phosphate adenylyltransferase [Kosmotoga arenicorallina S304]|uniref:Glucose-1-phosphate adenylyltransferase n=1 Tax=Kosmotoga arenicorallina S304 TaxID=1453497 RepID=A0A176K213_9BACT|nr:glucose-1-phosphate adenylyltransferase subunit GlgD [Kosmotoga arenicorallina]OAA30965.1 glucose-1-phosphate adenylyltransferase [Kosmotoga arenicorallina S304]
MKVLGLVLAGGRGENLRPFTDIRASAALPIFGKYRAIDFTLSNMVNAGISKVGIITQYNPRSLMDHIGSGKEWDLDRKQGGLFFLQPFFRLSSQSIGYKGTADAIFQNMTILRRGNEDFVLIGSGDHIYKMDFRDLFRAHINNGADITLLSVPFSESSKDIIRVEGGKVINWYRDITPSDIEEKENLSESAGVYFINKFLLRELLFSCVPDGKDNLVEIISENLSSLKVMEYKFKGFWSNLTTDVSKYFKTNLDILNPDIRKELFYKHGKVYTKLKDLPPPKITTTGRVSNALVSDGSIISGSVINSVIFRNVKILSGAVVENSIIMEGCVIEEGAKLKNVIMDKDARVRSSRKLLGSTEIPAVVEKSGVI